MWFQIFKGRKLQREDRDPISVELARLGGVDNSMRGVTPNDISCLESDLGVECPAEVASFLKAAGKRWKKGLPPRGFLIRFDDLIELNHNVRYCFSEARMPGATEISEWIAVAAPDTLDVVFLCHPNPDANMTGVFRLIDESLPPERVNSSYRDFVVQLAAEWLDRHR